MQITNGYVANVVGTFDDNGKSVITDYDFRQNRHSDSEFCKDAIKIISESGGASSEEKVILISDGAFADAENSALAGENNVVLVTAALTYTSPTVLFADFQIDKETRQVIQCPAEYVPIKQDYNPLTANQRAVMEKKHYENPRTELSATPKCRKKCCRNVTENKVERSKAANNGSVTD